MIKFNAGFIPGREANLIGLGFSEGNLPKLLSGKPLTVKSEELFLPGPGFDLVVFAAKDQKGIESRLKEMLPEPPGDEPVRLPVMRMANTFYLTALHPEGGRLLYLVGLDEVSFKALRNRSFPAFRVRFPQGGGTPVEVLLFWGPTEDHLEEAFYASGLIGPDTQVTRL